MGWYAVSRHTGQLCRLLTITCSLTGYSTFRRSFTSEPQPSELGESTASAAPNAGVVRTIQNAPINLRLTTEHSSSSRIRVFVWGGGYPFRSHRLLDHPTCSDMTLGRTSTIQASCATMRQIFFSFLLRRSYTLPYLTLPLPAQTTGIALDQCTQVMRHEQACSVPTSSFSCVNHKPEGSTTKAARLDRTCFVAACTGRTKKNEKRKKNGHTDVADKYCTNLFP